jgi:hypothetical protein
MDRIHNRIHHSKTKRKRKDIVGPRSCCCSSTTSLLDVDEFSNEGSALGACLPPRVPPLYMNKHIQDRFTELRTKGRKEARYKQDKTGKKEKKRWS